MAAVNINYVKRKTFEIQNNMIVKNKITIW